MPFKLNQNRRHPIPRQRHRVTNGRDYEASLRQRRSLTVWFTEQAIVAWAAAARTTRGGQRWYLPLAILTALTLQAVFRLAFRQTEGLIGAILSLLGLPLRVADHTTLSRRAARLEVPQPRRRPGPHAEALHLLVDSTGLKRCGAGAWLAEKHATQTGRSWRKRHIGVEADSGQIMASASTTKAVDDGVPVGPLLEQRTDLLTSFTGDGASDQDSVYAAVADRHPDTVPTQRDGHLWCIAKAARMSWQTFSGYNLTLWRLHHQRRRPVRLFLRLLAGFPACRFPVPCRGAANLTLFICQRAGLQAS